MNQPVVTQISQEQGWKLVGITSALHDWIVFNRHALTERDKQELELIRTQLYIVIDSLKEYVAPSVAEEKEMTDPNTRVTRLVLMGKQYKVVSAKPSDFDKMAEAGTVKMIAQWSSDCKAWLYFDGETRPPFRFEEIM